MKPRGSTRAWIVKLILLSAVAIFALAMVGWYTCLRAFVVSSGSMEKTLFTGDRVMVDRVSTFLGATPHRGDIVAYRWPLDPNQKFIHRIVGIPGDKLQLKDKKLFRNGAEVSEPYAQHSSQYLLEYRDNFPMAPNIPLREPGMDMLQNHVINGELVVPEGHYFVMGDNRDDAADSRYFGFIQRSDIIGRPILIYGSTDSKRAWTFPR